MKKCTGNLFQPEARKVCYDPSILCGREKTTRLLGEFRLVGNRRSAPYAAVEGTNLRSAGGANTGLYHGSSNRAVEARKGTLAAAGPRRGDLMLSPPSQRRPEHRTG